MWRHGSTLFQLYLDYKSPVCTENNHWGMSLSHRTFLWIIQIWQFCTDVTAVPYLLRFFNLSLSVSKILDFVQICPYGDKTCSEKQASAIFVVTLFRMLFLWGTWPKTAKMWRYLRAFSLHLCHHAHRGGIAINKFQCNQVETSLSVSKQNLSSGWEWLRLWPPIGWYVSLSASAILDASRLWPNEKRREL